MKKTSTHLFTFFFFILTSTLYGQEFNNIESIEKLFTSSSKQVDSTLIREGYILKSRDIKSNILTYKKSLAENKYTYTVNVLFENEKLQSFSWEDYINRGSYMVRDMNENYKINEEKTKDSLGIFYLESKTLDLDAIIFRTNINTQNGKIAFKISKSERKESFKKEPINSVDKDKLKDNIIITKDSLIENKIDKSSTTTLKKEELIANLNKYNITNPTYLYNSTNVNGQKILMIDKKNEIYSSEKVVVQKKKKKGGLNGIIGGNDLGQNDFVKCIYFDSLGKDYLGFVLKKDIEISQ